MGSESYIIVESRPGVDITQALTEAMGQAAGTSVAVYLKGKGGIVSAPVELKANLLGGGPANSGIVTTINDGQAAFFCDDGGNLSLSGFEVSGQSSTQAVTGIRLGVHKGNGAAVRRSILEDIRVIQCGVGIEHDGWINTWSNVQVHTCELGAKLSRQNGSTLQLIFEDCRRAFLLDDSHGITVPMLLIEGSTEKIKDPALLNSIHCMNIQTQYYEMAGTDPLQNGLIYFGNDFRCRNIQAGVALCYCEDYDLIRLRNVESFEMSITELSANRFPVEVNAMATDINIKQVAP